MSILLGNTFPIGLIRRKATFKPISTVLAKSILKNGFESFWGHADTLKAVNAGLGIDATPKQDLADALSDLP